jgi:hypothetical protein
MEEKKRKEGEMGAKIVDGDNVIGGSASGAGTASRVGEVRGKRKTKAPNPLSIRKKKAEPTKRAREEVEEEDVGIESLGEKEEGGGETEAGGKRRKKRKRGRGKGAVAEARAELAGMESGSEGGSDSE